MLIVDRIAQFVAICEDEEANQVKIALDMLPEDIAEGDILVPLGEGYQIDHEATERRKAAMRKKLNRLKRRS